jgi:hypothetical protein
LSATLARDDATIGADDHGRRQEPPMNPKDEKAHADESQKGAPPRRFDATLPHAKKEAAGPHEGGAEKVDDLDLDLGDIQSRLPYGSEDIADK